MNSADFIRFPWPCGIWRASERTAREAHKHECYEVTIGVSLLPKSTGIEDSPDREHGAELALESLWSALTQELRDGTCGALLDGGAVIRREGVDAIAVLSGGEDAVDSLSYTVNVTLVETAKSILPIANNTDVEIHFTVEHEGARKTA